MEQIAGDARYRLGPRIATLAGGLQRDAGLVATAQPTLVELAARTGEATGLSVPRRVAVHYVDQVDSPNPVQVRDWTGSRIPMHAVSSGQVSWPTWPRRRSFACWPGRVERFTSQTITEAGPLLDRLRHVRQDGYAWVREEYSDGISSVAAPVGVRRRRGHRRHPRPRTVVPLPGARFRGQGGCGRGRAAAQVGNRLRA